MEKEAATAGPTWKTPARLECDPAIWDRKYTRAQPQPSTFGGCVEKLLSLERHHYRSIFITWGEAETPNRDKMGVGSLIAYLIVNGLPPQMAAARNINPPADQIRAMLRYEPWNAHGNGFSPPTPRKTRRR